MVPARREPEPAPAPAFSRQPAGPPLFGVLIAGVGFPYATGCADRRKPAPVRAPGDAPRGGRHGELAKGGRAVRSRERIRRCAGSSSSWSCWWSCWAGSSPSGSGRRRAALAAPSGGSGEIEGTVVELSSRVGARIVELRVRGGAAGEGGRPPRPARLRRPRGAGGRGRGAAGGGDGPGPGGGRPGEGLGAQPGGGQRLPGGGARAGGGAPGPGRGGRAAGAGASRSSPPTWPPRASTRPRPAPPASPSRSAPPAPRRPPAPSRPRPPWSPRTPARHAGRGGPGAGPGRPGPAGAGQAPGRRVRAPRARATRWCRRCRTRRASSPARGRCWSGWWTSPR